MALLTSNVATLADWAKRTDPQGNVPTIVELLSQTNEILPDMLWKEGNLPTGHQFTVRTSLPTPSWRSFNEGVSPTKSTTAQVTEQCAMLESWSEVDKDLAELNGNLAQFRLSEAAPQLEGINQEFSSTLFYGNQGTAIKEFNGLATRYAATTGTNGQNIILGGGAGSDNTSIYLVAWGDHTVHGIFPKESKAGIMHEDLGLVTIQGANGIGGSKLRAYQDHWQWKCGLAVQDWRYVVRIANVDISSLVADGAGSSVKLMEYMLKAIHRIPSMGNVRPAFYMNRTVLEMLDIQAMNKSNLYLNVGQEEGKRKVTFRGIPLRTCDSLLETEATIS